MLCVVFIAKLPAEEIKESMNIQVKMQELQKSQLDMLDKQVTIEGKQIDNSAKLDDMAIQQMSTADLIRALG